MVARFVLRRPILSPNSVADMCFFFFDFFETCPINSGCYRKKWLYLWLDKFGESHPRYKYTNYKFQIKCNKFDRKKTYLDKFDAMYENLHCKFR